MDATKPLAGAKHFAGEPRALISRSALLHNVRVVRRALGPGVRLCAIVKADAYGHGAGLVVDTLCNFTDRRANADDARARPAVDALAVASVDEAAALPPVPESVQVLVFRPVENAFVGRQRLKIEEAVRRGWVLTLCSPAAAGDVARIAIACGRRAHVQVMLDTGMTRSGADLSAVDGLLERIASHPSLRLVGLCTHFCNADDPADPFTAEQLHRFRRATDAYIDQAASGNGRGQRPVRHAANSGALFALPASHLDMVRPGISLYGVDPSGRPYLDRPLRPAMKWVAPLLHVRDVPAGAGVGYGQTWRAPRDTRIGLVPVGYADGYPRCLSNKAFVVVHGKAAPVVGRVSMDLTTVDLGGVPNAVVGDDVTLLDDDPLSPASAYALARWSETIPHEVLCRVGARVRRVAVDPADGEPGARRGTRATEAE